MITEGGWQPDGCASLPSSGLESASFCLAHTVEARPVQGLWGMRKNNSDTPEEASLPLCSSVFWHLYADLIPLSLSQASYTPGS